MLQKKTACTSNNLDEYVVTATRTALTQKEVPQSVEVITKADIQNVGAISVKRCSENSNQSAH